MANDKKPLESFKVSDLQKSAPVASKSKTQAKAEAQQADAPTSLGFKRIEEVLDREDIQAVIGDFQQLHQQLSQKTASTPKDKANCQKAVVAVEHTLNLLAMLAQTRQNLIQANSVQ